MENRDPIFHSGLQANSNSGSNLLQAGNSASTNQEAQTQSNINTGNATPHVAVSEKYQYLPIAKVTKIMRQVLPQHTRISEEAKEMIQECLSEYISFITSEANEHCKREQRKTVTAKDLLCAMKNLGFDDYIEPLNVFLHRYRHFECDHSELRGEPIPVIEKGTVDNYMLGPAIGTPPPTLSPPLAHYGLNFTMELSTNIGMHDQMGMDGFYGHGSSSRSSSNVVANFDPSAHLKLDRI